MANEASAAVVEETSSAAAPSGNESAPSGGSSPSGPAPSGDPVEIDSLDRYRYQGQSAKEWRDGYMRTQDYTQKTQALAEERKYYANLDTDLDRVRQDPRLAEQFLAIYPEKFHSYLKYVTGQANSAQPAQGQRPNTPQYAPMDPKFLREWNELQKERHDNRVASINAELDSKFSTLRTKYPYADEEAVVARAQALFGQMKKADPLNPNLRISDKQWDALWKAHNDGSYKLVDSQYKKQVQAQINASKKGGDVGSGGGIPGAAPRQFKSIKEATAQALSDIDAGSFG